jgi:hypothetical protein
LRDLWDSNYQCWEQGVTYGSGSWGYTDQYLACPKSKVVGVSSLDYRAHAVLRTAHSSETDAIWPVAMEKLERWVTRYFVYWTRFFTNKPDTTIKDELARRFVIEVIDVEPERLAIPDLHKASLEDIKALGSIFEEWVHSAIGEKAAAEPPRRYCPRFYDFIVIDERSIATLAALPEDTPPLHLVSHEERRVRISICYNIGVIITNVGNHALTTTRLGVSYTSLRMCGLSIRKPLNDSVDPRTRKNGTIIHG